MIDLEGADRALARLERRLEELGPVAVAVSGGVDSMTLAWIAHRVNGASLLFHALSAAVPAAATERVREYAAREGWNLRVIDAGELRDASYVSNPADRCYFCKSCLYGSIQGETDLPVASGTNTDDLDDYRPGLRAAGERGVHHPFVEAGIDKETVRAIARRLGLADLSELPASPCLSSRVTTGIAIDPAVLRAIDDVEGAVWRIVDDAVRGVRCRIRDNGVAVEIEGGGAVKMIDEAVREAVSEILVQHGLAHLGAQITVEPYRRGSAFLIESMQIGE